MLTNVPAAVSRMARNVVINHPNTFSCQVFRKTVTRTASASMGGLPTMGGLGVISSDDEEQFEYAFLGNGYAMQAETFQPAQLMDRQDANNYSGEEFRLLIMPEAENDGEEGFFTPKKHDVVYLLIGDDDDPPKIAFEVVGIETPLNIPPYVTRYVCNRRDDLHVAAE